MSHSALGDNLKNKFSENDTIDYEVFENIFLRVLNTHAPLKKKIVRANHMPYMTKTLRKAIMRRSALENKYCKSKSLKDKEVYKKQRHFCNRLYKRERRKYFNNLNLKNIVDNKIFWKTMKPFLSNKGDFHNKIILIENDEIISDNKEVAQKLNNFFEPAEKSLGIMENQSLLSTSNGIDDPIDRIIKKYEIHPSILAIKDKVKSPLQKVSFSHISLSNMEREVKSLNGKKSATFQNIPAKHLKITFDICSPKLDEIWKNILIKCTFPNKLKIS